MTLALYLFDDIAPYFSYWVEIRSHSGEFANSVNTFDLENILSQNIATPKRICVTVRQTQIFYSVDLRVDLEDYFKLFNCGSIVTQGMLHARGEVLLMLDADGATGINELEYQLHAAAEYELNLHLGDAAPSDSSSRISDVPVAVFGSQARLENKARATCGFKMFSRGAAQKLFTNIHLKRWCFDVELVYLCKHLDIPMVEIAVCWYDIPGSKVNLLSSIPHMLWELVLMSVGHRCSIWKIRS